VKLAFDRGGEGERLLVLLHGLGATRHVWLPMLQSAPQHWNGSWIAPDLRGHGESPHARNYSLGCHASDVAELMGEQGPWRDIVILGHSMGGAVAFALASGWFGVAPAQVFGLGIKVAWTDEDLAGMRKLAATPVRVFETDVEAIARYLKVSGLSGLSAQDSAEAKAGVMQYDRGWRLACDSATANIGPPPMHALIAAADCPIHLARGETDGLVTLDQLREYDKTADSIAGAGHNTMVEKPQAVWAWLSSKLHDQ
jgi:pimeloyl-ACP methyl ester carboxylesterase